MSTTARPSERLVPANSADQPALRMDRFRDQEDRLRGACSSRPYLRSEKKRVAKRMAGAIRSGYSRAFQLHGSRWRIAMRWKDISTDAQRECGCTDLPIHLLSS